jgi:CelD/BcsL family acetyltransferase involved in cellulose biosynthesis
LTKAYGPIEQFVWTTSCLATLDASRPLRVVTLTRDHECVALAPMVLRRVRAIRRLVLIGVNDLHEPADLLAVDNDALHRLATSLVARREPMVIERMLADSPTLAALAQACRGRAILVRRPAPNCPYIPFDTSWLEPESHLNSGRRSDLRRARRKAEQAGPVRFEILTPAPADVDRLFDQAMAVEAKSWKGEARTALAYDGRRAEFFRHYVRQAAREGVLRICFMWIGDSPVAMQIAVEQQQGFWLLKIGYDASFATASPGLLLMRETIRYAAASGLRTYEFLGRAEAWTTVWTNQERSTVTVRVFPFTPRGLAALAADALAAGGRKTLGNARAAAKRINAWTSKPISALRGSLSRGPVPQCSAATESESKDKP